MTTLAELTRRVHHRHAHRPAVYDGTRWHSFAELGAAARRTAHRLLRHGLLPGDRVVVALANRPESLILDHALFLSGLVRVAVSSRLHGREIATIACDCAAAVVLCEESAAEPVRASGTGLVVTARDLADLVGPGVPDDHPAVPEPVEDDVAALMYTSGSTGEPKGAIVTHRGWLAMLRGFWADLPPLGPGDVVLHAAPMSHLGGSVGSAVTFRGGAAVPVGRADPATILAAVARHRVTVLPAVPTILTALTATAAAGDPDLSGLRAVVYGGAAISAPAAARAYDVFGDTLYQCYGLSEALAPVTVLGAADHRPGGSEGAVPDRLASAGRPTAEVEVRVTDVTGRPVTPGGTGEVRIRGDCVMPGYWRRPEASAAVFDDDGWFRSGDIGRFDADGYLHLVDRTGDVIVTGGFNVYPSEVERAIAELPAVRDVVVFGVPHDRWGEAVAAVVAVEPERTLSPEEVVAACRERLASYKKPLHIEITSALPTASTGKTARRAVRDRYWAGFARRVGG
ncbi:class I adenylate-forming enzyme family protein [Plantactinospora sp. GCM10030261]|uniref:class I adenylate-forming enzyme family protein n=1 Tax=Plantactinospora sp. GCM10030261 TaxID=3273420 RepID=UPI003611C18F